MNDREVLIDYTNWRGERAVRRIEPKRMWFGITTFHSAPQWFVNATDSVTGQIRDFAMKDIHDWKPASEATTNG